MAAFSLKTFRLFTINFEKFDWSLLTNFEHRKFLHLTLQEDHFLPVTRKIQVCWLGLNSISKKGPK